MEVRRIDRQTDRYNKTFMEVVAIIYYVILCLKKFRIKFKGIEFHKCILCHLSNQMCMNEIQVVFVNFDFNFSLENSNIKLLNKNQWTESQV